jgi:hypothetical protein
VADRFSPSGEQLWRRDSLVHLLGNALSWGEELALPAAVLHRVARVAVDVTCGEASDVELRAAAERYLGELHVMVEAEPIRRALRGVIDEIDDEMSVAPEGEGLAHHVSNDLESDAIQKKRSA